MANSIWQICGWSYAMSSMWAPDTWVDSVWDTKEQADRRMEELKSQEKRGVTGFALRELKVNHINNS